MLIAGQMWQRLRDECLGRPCRRLHSGPRGQSQSGRTRQKLQFARKKSSPAFRPSDFSARRLWQGAGQDKRDDARLYVDRFDHAASNPSEKVLRAAFFQSARNASIRFENDRESFLVVLRKRKRDRTAGPNAGGPLLDNAFDVLGIEVASGDDDEILQSSRDETVAAAEKAEIASAQILTAFVPVDRRFKCPRGLLRSLPIAFRYAGAFDPNFTNFVFRTADKRFWMNNLDMSSRPDVSTSDDIDRFKAVARRNIKRLEGLAVDFQYGSQLAAARRGDNERRLGQTVTRKEARP
nr:hypothetical protein [Methylocystis iwaonis]